MGLRVNGRCETVRGPGVVKKILNANRWHPVARIDVQLDGMREWVSFTSREVWEAGKERPEWQTHRS